MRHETNDKKERQRQKRKGHKWKWRQRKDAGKVVHVETIPVFVFVSFFLFVWPWCRLVFKLVLFGLLLVVPVVLFWPFCLLGLLTVLLETMAFNHPKNSSSRRFSEQDLVSLPPSLTYPTVSIFFGPLCRHHYADRCKFETVPQFGRQSSRDTALRHSHSKEHRFTMTIKARKRDADTHKRSETRLDETTLEGARQSCHGGICSG